MFLAGVNASVSVCKRGEQRSETENWGKEQINTGNCLSEEISH